MSFIRELRRRNVFKVAVAYAIVGWALVQVAAIVFPALRLPDWTVTFVTAALILCLPIALLLAWAYELTPAGIKRTPDLAAEGRPVSGRRLGYFATALLAGGVGAGLFWFASRDGDAQWLRVEAIPAIEAHIDKGEWEAAYARWEEAGARVPNSPALAELWPRFAWRIDIPTDPPGATVYRRAFGAADTDWERLGVTPLRNVTIPFGLSELRFELDGYRPLLRTIGGGAPELLPTASAFGNNFLVGTETFKLDTKKSLPDGKVRVPAWTQPVGGKTVQFHDFFLDRYEVTNAQYKAFVQAGGYRRPELWDPIARDGATIPWNEAMKLFVDRTGRPGPANWEAGDFPEGRDDYPVSGISWYEAMAYARFMGQELPTAYHWQRGLAVAALSWLLPASALQTSGPRSVRAGRAMSYTGAFDMTGNVREWTATSLGKKRLILGGGWNDTYYVVQAMSTADPLDRSPSNGMRLALTADEPAVASLARAPMKPPPIPAAAEPVSDEIYNAYSRAFAYERRPLNAVVAATKETRLWTRQRITFDAAYGGRMVLYLFLPAHGRPPYQTVVFWPGADATFLGSIDGYVKFYDFILKSGRAVAFPVYQGTFERGGQKPLPPWDSIAYRDNAIAGVKDLRRSVDYLGTRKDIDPSRIGFFGESWGGVNGASALAQEPRISAAVIFVGFLPSPVSPEVDPVNALPRVHVPTLLLSGEYDIIGLDNPRRFFGLIGTRASDKKHVIAPGGHYVPRVVLIRETLNWLDKYFGVPAGAANEGS